MAVGCLVACQVKPQQHHPSCSSLVFKKEGFIILRYKYPFLSVQSIHRNWCCNIKTTEFTFPVRTCSVQLAGHTRVMFTVYFIACLMHKVKYKPEKVIGRNLFSNESNETFHIHFSKAKMLLCLWHHNLQDL